MTTEATFTHLDLFAGIGGFSRAVDWLGGHTLAFVEWDAWNRRVLAKHWPEAHFHGDIKTFTAATLREWGIRTYGSGAVDTDESRELHGAEHGQARSGQLGEQSSIDLITGGYPCQPFSLAGQRLGAEDDRHLWPEMRRVVNLVRPRWVLAENVAGHVTMGLDTVLSDLEADGYACGAVVIPACAVNAIHRRDRVWIMAHAEGGTRVPAAHGGSGGNRGPTRLEVAGSGSGLDERDPEPGMGDAAAPRRAPGPGEPGGPLRHEAWWPEPERRRSTSRGHGESETPRSLDAGPDGLPAGLVRRSAVRSAGLEPWDDPDSIRAMWANGSWELGLPRVVTTEPERRQKLQAAGNAIVPLVAYEVLRVMLGMETDQ